MKRAALAPRRHVHLNQAIALCESAGLVAPVLRAVKRQDLLRPSAEQATLVARAKSGVLRPNDFADGTFTRSNRGRRGVAAAFLTKLIELLQRLCGLLLTPEERADVRAA